MSRDQLICQHHKNENINHFCLQKNCVTPLCTICLEEHNNWHVQQQTHANYITIQKLLNCFQNMNEDNIMNIDEIDNFTTRFNIIYDQHLVRQELKNQIDQFIEKIEIQISQVEKDQKQYFSKNMPQFNQQTQNQMKFSLDFQKIFQNNLQVDFIKNTIINQDLLNVQFEIEQNLNEIQNIKNQFVNFVINSDILQQLQSQLQEYVLLHYDQKQLYSINKNQQSVLDTFELKQQNQQNKQQIEKQFQFQKEQSLRDIEIPNDEYSLNQEIQKMKFDSPNHLDNFQFSPTSTQQKQRENSIFEDYEPKKIKEQPKKLKIFTQIKQEELKDPKNHIDNEQDNQNKQSIMVLSKNNPYRDYLQNSDEKQKKLTFGSPSQFDNQKNDSISLNSSGFIHVNGKPIQKNELNAKSSFKEAINQPNTYLNSKNVYVNEQLSVQSNVQENKIDDQHNNPYRRMLAAHNIEFDKSEMQPTKFNKNDFNPDY